MSSQESSDWNGAVVRNRQPLQPITTAVSAELKRLPGIKAVIFDVYGTLLVSGSGDVGSADDSDRGDWIAAAIDACGIAVGSGRIPTMDDLRREIQRSNQQRVSPSCPKPEVDIVAVWRRTLAGCGLEDPGDPKSAWTATCVRLAAEYESRANPTWPMPAAVETLQKLSRMGMRLGIVSNAQGFTLPLVEDLAGRFGVDSVFDANLCVFSNRYRQAKPGPRLFDVLCDGLRRAGMSPSDAIYVGNDRLNDVWAATQAGLRTAWFAGDRRSLRDRNDDPRVAGLDQDIILTRLEQLLDCIDDLSAD
ncbi:HAD family hydrolase [Stieleria sp. TO1_6]|uniref:HAD family hydrolase n=1 Tax=Stieleria tagensis TaxID=2956795 RepID=UPI00209B7EEA|nr:HAD family hydrolase [Stieleria tagensis]MCO8121217.1 HAD family hydrolase [Stieleria tagensis]